MTCFNFDILKLSIVKCNIIQNNKSKIKILFKGNVKRLKLFYHSFLAPLFSSEIIELQNQPSFMRGFDLQELQWKMILLTFFPDWYIK